jgi:hypothetical protein
MVVDTFDLYRLSSPKIADGFGPHSLPLVFLHVHELRHLPLLFLLAPLLLKPSRELFRRRGRGHARM